VLGYYVLNNKKDNSQEQVAQEKAQVTEEKVINVGVLQLLSHPALDSIYKGMVEELARQGYEDGKNIRLDLQNAQGEQSNLALMSEKLVSEKNDILVGITTPATLSLANATKDIPIIPKKRNSCWTKQAIRMLTETDTAKRRTENRLRSISCI